MTGWTEEARLAALQRYAILDTPPEPAFDDAAALVKTICAVPIALISFVDAGRQWFKARIGVDAVETGLDTSVCALAIRQSGIFVIEDLARDPRTADMALVTGPPHIRFYAGTPLVTSDGMPLGSLCAIDLAPRPGGLTADQTGALEALGRQVVAQIELRHAVTARDHALVAQERRRAQVTRDAAILQTMLRAQQDALRSGGDMDAVLRALVEAALAAVEPAQGVAIVVREGDHMLVRAAAGTSARGDRMPVAGSLAAIALATQEALIASDLHTDERVDPALYLHGAIRSSVVVPLTRHGAAFGVLRFVSREPRAFRPRHILIGQMLAGLIGAIFSDSAEASALHRVAQVAQDYRHIVDSAIDSAIISTDAEGRITSWSRGAETIMGWREADVLGQPLGIIFTPEDNASGRPARELLRAREEGRASDERWHIRRDGTRFFAHGAVTPLLRGASEGFVKSLRDITDDHRTRTALEQSRVRLDTALDTGLIGFFNWNVPAGTVSGDPRFADFFGIDRARAADGVPLAEAFAGILPADREMVNVAHAEQATTCDDYSRSYRTRCSDGSERWLRVRGRCIEHEGGRPLAYVGTAVDVTQQRATDERLRVSSERLELATRAAQLGSFDFFPRTGQLDWDDRCRALFGVSPGAPVSYEGTFLAGLHPDDRAAADAAVATALDPAGTGTFDMEYRTVGIEDGMERAVLAKGLALFGEGDATRLIGTVQDITAERAARARLLETEERLRLAARATNDAIWDWDLRRDQVLWNEALQIAHGHAPDMVEPTGAWWLAHIHPDDRERVTHGIHAAIDGDARDWTDEYRFERADGRYADVRDRGSVIRDAEGRAIRMIGAMLDQTERKQAERDLRHMNETLAESVTERTQEIDRLWATSPDMLTVLDFDGVIQRVNPAWITILGYRPEELVGRQIFEFVHPDDIALTEDALQVAGRGPLPTVENRYLAKDGSVHWFAWVAAPTDSEIYATGRHITAQKEAEAVLRSTEEQLRHAQKVEAIGQLTGGVAHDFNNLLTVIRGSADLLRRPDLSEARRTRYIDAIADTADRATKLTSQLLAFARRSTLKPEIFDAGASIATLKDMILTLTGSMIRLEIDVFPTPCFVEADPSQFDTAIVNMAVNARDAMERQGDLHIAITPVAAMPAIRGHPVVAGAYVAVSIRDTGSGIAPDRIDHIFEPFFTTKEVGEGTGLGLSQVFGFAKQSGGEIAVSSTPGEGTTFTLYLPRVLAPADSDVAVRAEVPAIRAGACILVVEDNQDVGRFAMQALTELGHHSVLTTSGEAALATLAEGGSFDAVFSDVVMPGMGGVELARAVRAAYPRLPVLLTSGYSSALAAEGTHGFDLLHKPYSIEELARALQRVIVPQASLPA